MCDESCRLALARAVCATLSPAHAPPPDAELLLAEHAMALLQPRAFALRRELGCESFSGEPPPLQGHAVSNGKSGSSFLVPGASHVSPTNPSTFSAIFKQVNAQEAALLSSLYPSLAAQYTRSRGSMLTPILGWLRYTPAATKAATSATAAPFECLIMENAARPPPGLGRTPPGGGWKPFDMKGIRLYSHERRFDESFGAGGLRISRARFERMRTALAADIGFLAERSLVDFSYLATVFPTGAAPRPCACVWADADYHTGASLVAGSPRDLLAASYRLPATTTASVTAAATPSMTPASSTPTATATASSSSVPLSATATPDGGEVAGRSDGRSDLCVPVLVRLSIIDYLREWRMTERVEHLQKSLTRDLLAGERNHAVVPVRQFAQRFEAFFTGGLFTPVPPPQLPFVTLAADALSALTNLVGARRSDSGLGRDEVVSGAHEAFSRVGSMVGSFVEDGRSRLLQSKLAPPGRRGGARKLGGAQEAAE